MKPSKGLTVTDHARSFLSEALPEVGRPIFGLARRAEVRVPVPAIAQDRKEGTGMVGVRGQLGPGRVSWAVLWVLGTRREMTVV